MPTRRTRAASRRSRSGSPPDPDEHTPQEWIDIAPIADGIAAIADTVVRYEARDPLERRSSP